MFEHLGSLPVCSQAYSLAWPYPLTVQVTSEEFQASYWRADHWVFAFFFKGFFYTWP